MGDRIGSGRESGVEGEVSAGSARLSWVLGPQPHGHVPLVPPVQKVPIGLGSRALLVCLRLLP